MEIMSPGLETDRRTVNDCLLLRDGFLCLSVPVKQVKHGPGGKKVQSDRQ